MVDSIDKHVLDDIITSEYKRLQLPGLAYASVRNDSILYMGAKGYANIKKKTPFTTRTRTTIASTSKTFVVTAIGYCSETIEAALLYYADN